MFNTRPGKMGQAVSQGEYKKCIVRDAEIDAHFTKKLPAGELEKYQAFKRALDWGMNLQEQRLAKREHETRVSYARELFKARVAELIKAGVTTATGYNFYDLRGPAYLIYPVNTPFRNSLARMGRVNDGVGTAAHWQATRNFGTTYVGVLEGQRNQIATPDDNTYVATYKEIGVERGVTFTAEFAGEGYTDNVADEHIRGLNELWLGEEGLNLVGNSGIAAGNNGYALGTANTPSGTKVAGGSFTDTHYISAYVVFGSALANPNNTQYGYGLFPTVASGLTPAYVRTNQDGSQTTVNGGWSIPSAASTPVQVTSPDLSVTFTVTPKNGSYWYAWFIDDEATNTANPANAYLAAITSLPSYTATAPGAGTQTITLLNALTPGGGTDTSFQPADYDGLLTYAATTSGARYVNQLGASFTSLHNGQVSEIEADLEYLWANYQAQPTCIYGSYDAIQALSQTALASGTNPNAYRWQYERDSQNNILAGFVVSAYQSRFSMNQNGAAALPLRIHPQLPPGTIYYDIEENPYPQSRIPFVRGHLVQRDYYSIEWPVVTRQWTFGTYSHQVLAHLIPQISAVRTGISATPGT